MKMFMKREFDGNTNFFKWKDVKIETYPQKELFGVSKQILLSAEQTGGNFDVRYYHFDPGSIGDLARHDREYCFLVVHGRANLLLNDESYPLNCNDVVYISPHELIQVIPEGDEPLGFFCITNK
jgi:mannose-6-phosphate isomerase-like protein (cupin superfamily)